MSHFLQIQSNPKLEPQTNCILSIPHRQIIMPKYSRLQPQNFSLSSLSTPVSKKNLAILDHQQGKQKLLLQGLCDRLAQNQLTKLQHENQVALRKKFNQIKKKLRNTAVPTGNLQKDSEVLKYFQNRNRERDLSTLLSSNHKVENIQINIKYHTKITHKLLAIKQVMRVEEDKKKYRNWLDWSKNSPQKSANFCKMNFVIQKIKESGCGILQTNYIQKSTNNNLTVSKKQNTPIINSPTSTPTPESSKKSLNKTQKMARIRNLRTSDRSFLSISNKNTNHSINYKNNNNNNINNNRNSNNSYILNPHHSISNPILVRTHTHTHTQCQIFSNSTHDGQNILCSYSPKSKVFPKNYHSQQ